MRIHMTKKIICAAAILAVTAAVAPIASAETTTFGMGIIVGEPTGIGAKLQLDSGNALAFGLAWSLEGDNELHVQADYLYHNYNVFPVDQGQLPLYFGVGGRIKINDEHNGKGGDDNVGIRFPVGIAYIFDGAPFDVFMEIVPILDVAPDTDFDLNGAIGGRYWF